jgi:hypothetical protein
MKNAFIKSSKIGPIPKLFESLMNYFFYLNVFVLFYFNATNELLVVDLFYGEK